ncbi:GNAT family N-acetyltransferase [Terasakiella sp. A23]|uniref:GNAT family N-acetyltransferase n=1 Tax=Terasakiella sp. FCG-A23 TaxID=3080561 RepID=UPI0029547335|nr:GNAT family N-acetyltransferase [Terasakiella sp. A23]MDV7341161.1 GNAT family N-acetyltransferase [Terasakiella sp. A23]
MDIRPMTTEDKTQWRELWGGYLGFYNVMLAEEVTKGVWDRLLNPDNPLRGFVCVEKGKLIGFTHYFFHGTTWYPSSYCYLEDLYVDQSVRSKGAGRALIEAVKEAAKKEGAAKLYWHTDKKNEIAQALYNKVATLSDYVKYDVVL